MDVDINDNSAREESSASYSRVTISTDMPASEGGAEVNELDVDVPLTVIEMVRVVVPLNPYLSRENSSIEQFNKNTI